MRGGRRAEQVRERQLTIVVEVVLLAEEDHLVLEKRRVDRRRGRRVEVACEVHAVDAGADVGAEFHNLHVPKLTSAGLVDKGLAHREQNGM